MGGVGHRALEIGFELEWRYLDDSLSLPGSPGSPRSRCWVRRGRPLRNDRFHARRFGSRLACQRTAEGLQLWRGRGGGRGFFLLRSGSDVDVAFQHQVRVLETRHDILGCGLVGDSRLELRHRFELQIRGVQLFSDGWRLRRGGAHLTEVSMRGFQALEHPARTHRGRFVDEARRLDLQ